jgi:response regulator RpfG family c-di-GMP phosphodiesterase
MWRVLFVDDEPRILDALSRMLRGLRRQWEMEFADSGHKALEYCATQPFDVVASDARMPGMDGTTLLREIMLRYPDTVRIILSGQCSRAAVVQAVDVAHQFLTKPCDAQTLKATIQSVCGMRERFSNGQERVTFTRVQRLPSRVESFDRLVEELREQTPDMERVTEVLEGDVAFTAKTVQLVSSSFFGTPQHTFSAAHAARLLGPETLQAIANSSEAFLSSDHTHSLNSEVAAINRHSRQVAVLAKRLATTVSADRHLIGDSHLAGMLHDVAALALLNGPSPGAAPTAASSRGYCHPVHNTEIDPGGYLAALWGLDEHVVQAISYYRTPALCPNQQFSPLTVLHAAHVLVEAGSEEPIEVDHAYLQRTGSDRYWKQWQELCQDACLEGAAL